MVVNRVLLIVDGDDEHPLVAVTSGSHTFDRSDEAVSSNDSENNFTVNSNTLGVAH